MYKFVIFYLISIFGFSQKSIDVKFNNRGIILYEGVRGLDTLNVLKANIKTKYGKFTLQLIDNNKNDEFNDNDYVEGLHVSKFDALHISKYKSEYIQTTFYSPPLAKENKFIFNGIVFELYSLKKDNQIINAKIKILKGYNNYKKLIDDGTLIYSDKLNKVCVYDLENDKKVKLKQKILKKKTYFMPIYANVGIKTPNSYNIEEAEKSNLKNIEIIYIIIFSPKEKIDFFKKLMTLKNKVYYLKVDDYRKFCEFGFNEIHRGSLFDKNGKLIDNNIYPFDLYKYDN